MKIYLTIEPEPNEDFETYETGITGGLTYITEQVEKHIYSFTKSLKNKTYEP